jgi:hypothetical protein
MVCCHTPTWPKVSYDFLRRQSVRPVVEATPTPGFVSLALAASHQGRLFQSVGIRGFD